MKIAKMFNELFKGLVNAQYTALTTIEREAKR